LGLFIIWGGIKGFRKGFLLEFLSVVIFVVGVVLIFFTFSKGFLLMKDSFQNATRTISFIFLFFCFLAGGLGLNYVGRRLQEKINYSIFDDFDNVLGLLMGFLKYAMFISILIGLLDAVGYKLPPAVTKDSYIYPLLLRFQKWLVEVGAVIAPFIRQTAEDIEHLLS
jgi:membrane protein required for colicin V production